MIRRACAWTAAGAAVLSLLTASPVAADENPAPPVTSSHPTDPSPEPTTTPPTAGTGEVTVPDPDAPAPRGPRLLVFGDSISATYRYSIRGTADRPKAWWAHVAEAAGLPADEVMVSAEGGSGLLARGKSKDRTTCGGTTFGDRLGVVPRTDPDVVIVEVGRNDIKNCVRGTPRRATARERRIAATRYFDALARTVDREGVRRSNVYVMTAWGSAFGSGHVAVTTLYEAEARARGFSWIPLPALVAGQTTDATHPNARGTRALAKGVLRSSDVATAIRSSGARHAPVPAGATTLCTGARRCRAAAATPTPLRPSRQRTWGTNPGTPQHYAAQRLTRGQRPVAPVLGAANARRWRTVAFDEGAAIAVAHARVGDVAWWHTAPAGAGSGRGHVAVVERVARDNSSVVVSEASARGALRSVRYSGASLPRAYLRFKRTDGSPRGHVTALRGTRGELVVRGRAVDTDALGRRVRIRVTVGQSGRTWTRTMTTTNRGRFAKRLALPRLRAGRAKVRAWALDAPGTRGADRRIAMQRIRVR